jgi:hypothetical protein
MRAHFAPMGLVARRKVVEKMGCIQKRSGHYRIRYRDPWAAPSERGEDER